MTDALSILNEKLPPDSFDALPPDLRPVLHAQHSLPPWPTSQGSPGSWLIFGCPALNGHVDGEDLYGPVMQLIISSIRPSVGCA